MNPESIIAVAGGAVMAAIVTLGLLRLLLPYQRQGATRYETTQQPVRVIELDELSWRARRR